MVALGRGDRPGVLLSSELRERLAATLAGLAAALPPVVTDREVDAFARAAVEACIALVPRARRDVQDPQKRLRRAIVAERVRAHDDDETVRRAVGRIKREDARDRRATSRFDVAANDPLRPLLDLPPQGRVALPKSDLRAHIVRAAGGSTLGGLLRKAALFSDELLRPALGAELFAMGRVVGFADRTGKRVLIEVKSSAYAQELSLRKQEIVYRLRKVAGFEDVEDVRFDVADR